MWLWLTDGNVRGWGPFWVLQETNLSVMMPGDSIPSFLAKAKPHGSASGADISDLLVTGAKDTSQTLR